LLADYVLRNYGPDPTTGKPRRVMMLVFEGENAVEKIGRAAGHLRYSTESAETVRGTYGDFIKDERNEVKYVEPP